MKTTKEIGKRMTKMNGPDGITKMNTQKRTNHRKSSFVVSGGKRTSNEPMGNSPKEEKSGEPDIMEAFKLVIKNGRQTVKMIMDAQKEKNTSEEDKLDQEDQRMKIVELEKLEEPSEEGAAIICGN